MATSPNYAWAEPDNSSLVKNGASDIRTLGDAIDTSVWNVGYGQASKNKIINGDFRVNQRSFSSTTTSAAYMFDRWNNYLADGTVTYSAQTFTPGAAPVAGYESANFIRCVTSGQTAAGAAAQLAQPIEDVRTFAGQTVTVSFYAKAGTGTPKIGIELAQNFGSGGSATVFSAVGAVTISTSWVRYSATYAVPSISGKTIGTSSFLGLNLWTSAGTSFATRASSIGIQSATIDIWGVQLEYGSKVTPFQTASGGSFQGELAMCQRYYWRATVDAAAKRWGYGTNTSTTQAQHIIPYPVVMRSIPTALEQTGTAGDYSIIEPAGATAICDSVPTFLSATNFNAMVQLTSSAGTLTQYRGSAARSVNANAYLGWSAEL